MSRFSALSITFALVATAASVSAMDAELQSGGLVIGQSNKTDSSIDVAVGLQSKYIDHGYVVVDDAVARTAGTVRWFGLGLSLEAVFALSQDVQPIKKAWDPSPTFTSREVNPGETVGLNGTIDYLIDVNGVYADNTPFLQFRPYLNLATYPNQQNNLLKEEQTWVGADLWLALPIPGVEVGTDNAFNLENPAYRGGAGLREIFQADNFDIQLWQLVNYGNRHNRALYMDYQPNIEDYSRGVTYSEIGAKATMPMPYREWWIYSKANWTYWMKSDDRDFQRDVLARDGGNLELGVGIEWIPERGFETK